MNIPGVYNQRDPRWANVPLGFNAPGPYDIGHFGCLITSVANLLWYTGANRTPLDVNNQLKTIGGYIDGGLVVWEKILELHPDLRNQGYTNSLVDANNFAVADGNFAILQVTGNGINMHFVLLVSPNLIADPWDGATKLFSDSGYTFQSAHLYGDVTPDFTTTPQPATTKPGEPPEMIGADDVNDLSLVFTGHPRGAFEDQFIGQSWHDAYYGIKDSQPAKDYAASLQKTEPIIVPIVEHDVQPEYIKSFVERVYDQITTEESFALDMTSKGGPVRVPKGSLVHIGGTFDSDGKQYVRTVENISAQNDETSSMHGTYYGLPTSAFEPPSDPVGIVIESAPQSDTSQSAPTPESGEHSLLFKLLHLAATIVSPLLKLAGRKS